MFNEAVIKLLSYKPPPMDVVMAGGYVDKSELAVAVRDILRCLIARAIKPSPLKPALRLMEMERVYSILSFECLGNVSECKWSGEGRGGGEVEKEGIERREGEREDK